MSEYEFIDSLVAAGRWGALSAEREKFAAALKANPGKWAKSPGSVIGTAKNAHYNFASSVKRGRLSQFEPAGAFEAVARDGIAYVRYVGGAA